MISVAVRQRVWVEVDLERIRHNLRTVAGLVGPARVLPVVKAEAYGHGLVQVGLAVAGESACWGLGVVTVEEGVRLRDAGVGKPIVVLGPSLEFEWEDALKRDISLAVYEPSMARDLSRLALRLELPVKVHVKVDTGLGRLALPAADAVPFIREVASLPGVVFEGLYSHFSDAEGLDQSYTLLQVTRYRQLLADLGDLQPQVRHIAGSAAGILLPETRYDFVRLGISLYGMWAADETRALMLSREGRSLLTDSFEEVLQPALSFKTVVAQVKPLPAGALVGYGCTYETKRETRAAILPVGYAEGYDRHLSNLGEVVVRGRRARVLGRICMNMTTVDVTDIPDVEAGDEVALIGCQGTACVRAEELARKIGSIHYEVVTRIPPSIPRIYRG